jgi:quinol monooxygenase YgiN
MRPVEARAEGGVMAMFEVSARLKIRDGQLEGFKRQAAEIMRLTREKDTKTLRYDWFLSDDGTECEVRESYVDADALIEHSNHIADARAKLYHDFAYDHTVTFYAEPSPGLAAALDAMPSGAVKLRRFSSLQSLDADLEVAEEVPA